jgi:hypothetical protein
MRRDASFVATVSAGLLVIGFGLIATAQASAAGKHPISDGWVVGCAVAGIVELVIAALMYVWLPTEERHPNADRRRHELRTGEELETGRYLCSRNGRHRLSTTRRPAAAACRASPAP